MTYGAETVEFFACVVTYLQVNPIHLEHDRDDDPSLHPTGPAAPDSVVSVHGYVPEIASADKWIVLW